MLQKTVLMHPADKEKQTQQINEKHPFLKHYGLQNATDDLYLERFVRFLINKTDVLTPGHKLSLISTSIRVITKVTCYTVIQKLIADESLFSYSITHTSQRQIAVKAQISFIYLAEKDHSCRPYHAITTATKGDGIKDNN